MLEFDFETADILIIVYLFCETIAYRMSTGQKLITVDPTFEIGTCYI